MYSQEYIALTMNIIGKDEEFIALRFINWRSLITEILKGSEGNNSRVKIFGADTIE